MIFFHKKKIDLRKSHKEIFSARKKYCFVYCEEFSFFDQIKK
jgi:hypothetical protein